MPSLELLPKVSAEASSLCPSAPNACTPLPLDLIRPMASFPGWQLRGVGALCGSPLGCVRAAVPWAAGSSGNTESALINSSILCHEPGWLSSKIQGAKHQGPRMAFSYHCGHRENSGSNHTS